MTGSRLDTQRAKLGGSIQDPSHILIRLGPCVSRGWRVGGMGAMLAAYGREVPPKIRRESEGQRKVESLTRVVLGRSDEGQQGFASLFIVGLVKYGFDYGHGQNKGQEQNWKESES